MSPIIEESEKDADLSQLMEVIKSGGGDDILHWIGCLSDFIR